MLTSTPYAKSKACEALHIYQNPSWYEAKCNKQNTLCKPLACEYSSFHMLFSACTLQRKTTNPHNQQDCNRSNDIVVSLARTPAAAAEKRIDRARAATQRPTTTHGAEPRRTWAGRARHISSARSVPMSRPWTEARKLPGKWPGMVALSNRTPVTNSPADRPTGGLLGSRSRRTEPHTSRPSTDLPACLLDYLPTWMPTYLPAYLPTYQVFQ
jgi:hypothetical protein